MSETDKVSDKIWQNRGDTFWPGTTSSNSKEIPAGLYRYETSMMGWYLKAVGDNFKFPYKIYGNQSHITSRIQRAWTMMESNLGILLNGIKGTGKTVTAQLVANWAIEQGYPVLMVNSPVPLIEILERVEQPMMVIFDEFEKTHLEPEQQQGLLTALDGMSRSQYKRLFVFTTNSKTIDENFIDRPSRIRYCWEFKRLEEDVIEEIIDDILDPALNKFRADIVSYINTRQVCSIDVAKTVINEVNMFREAPSDFAETMNLTEQCIRSLSIDQLNTSGEIVRNLASYFTPQVGYMKLLSKFMTRSGAEEFHNTYTARGSNFSLNDSFAGQMSFQLINPTDDPFVWIANMSVSTRDTWASKYPKLMNASCSSIRWLNKEPKDWAVPGWVLKLENGIDMTTDEREKYDDWIDSGYVYPGYGELQKVIIKITPKYESTFKTYSLSSGNAFIDF